MNTPTSAWLTYPITYRQREVQAIAGAIRGGECAAVLGLSGSGKSNLLGFLQQRGPEVAPPLPVLVGIDCNRLSELSPAAFLRQARQVVSQHLPADQREPAAGDDLAALDASLERLLQHSPGVCLLVDRLDGFIAAGESGPLLSNLRALRDAHKYQLSYVIATRRPLPPASELAELFFGRTLWLGPLSESDARWNVTRIGQRFAGFASGELDWEAAAGALIAASWGYPSFLRAACEAYAAGATLDVEALRTHPAVQRRVSEFLADQPTPEELRLVRLEGHPFLAQARSTTEPKASISPAPGTLAGLDPAALTAKEQRLLEYLLAHPGEVCTKDDLIRAVWPEDQIYTAGVRDDSLAQLASRLRKKLEKASPPARLHSIVGRGYRLEIYPT